MAQCLRLQTRTQALSHLTHVRHGIMPLEDIERGQGRRHRNAAAPERPGGIDLRRGLAISVAA